MKTLVKLAMLCGCLSACAAWPPAVVGDTAAQAEASMGKPTAVYALPAGQLLEYATGPMGQRTFMVHVGADGRVTGIEQVLTTEKFASLRIGVDRYEDVLRAVGHPAERVYLPHLKMNVWSYRYKENGVWNSLMSLHFDADGVLRLAQNGPDPMAEEHSGRHS